MILQLRFVDSVSQYAELTRSFKEKHSGALTNCFLRPDRVQEHVSAGNFLYASDDDNLLFFASEAHCFRLYFYAASLQPLEQDCILSYPNERKPVVLELLTRGGDTDTEKPIEAKWLRSGFHERNVFQRMSATRQDLLANKLYVTGCGLFDQEEGFSIHQRDEARIPEILALWEQGLDPISIELPDQDGLAGLMAQGAVRFMLDENDGLCAAVIANLHGKRVLLNHLCAHPSFRSTGLAVFFMAAVIREYVETGAEAFLSWIDTENHPSVRMYAGLGFKPDGMVSTLYMRQP